MALIKFAILIVISASIALTSAEDLFDVKGKVAIITGGVGGIGQEYARALLTNKLKVAFLLDINDTNAKNVINDLEAEFGVGSASFIKVDVRDVNKLDSSFQQVADRYNQLDIVINNAGVADESEPKQLADTDFMAVTEGTYLAFNKYLPRYKSGREGVVINTASITGLLSFPSFPVYSASKAGLISYGRSMGTPHYYEPDNIKIITLCPGLTHTPMISPFETDLPPYMNATSYGSFQRIQKAKFMGDCLIKSLKEGETGSVWVADNSKPARKIDFTAVDGTMYNQILGIA